MRAALSRRAVRSALAAVLLAAASVVAVFVASGPAQAAPVFKAPFPCGQRWTYSHHSAEVRRALDFIRDNGATNGAPVLASAAGTATRYSEPGGAGNYIIINHGGGWTTYYFHLGSYSVPSGSQVAQGQQIGTTGSTGNSSGPHQHYEQLYNGQGQDIRINGASLAPYPGSYWSKYLVSDNGCSGGGGKAFMTWGDVVNVRSDAKLTAPVVTTVRGGTLVYVTCQKQGDPVTAEGITNDWWAKLRDQNGYMTNIYIDDPAYKLPDVPEC